MYQISGLYEKSIEIKKSKFLSFAFPVFDTLEADKILGKLRQDYRDATHICYALVLSSPSYEKCSDDGEPEGTAGKPMLELIKKRLLTDILVVVVRYFGGIKLGAGGLARAYSSSANSVISECKLGHYKLLYRFKVTSNLSESKNLLSKINKNEIKIVNQIYGENFEVEILTENSVLDFIDCSYELLGQEKVFYDKDK